VGGAPLDRCVKIDRRQEMGTKAEHLKFAAAGKIRRQQNPDDRRRSG